MNTAIFTPRKILWFIMLGIAIGSFVAALYTFRRYLNQHYGIVTSESETLQQKIFEDAKKINTNLQSIVSKTTKLAEDMSLQKISHDEFVKQLKRFCIAKYVEAAGYAYEPLAFEKTQELKSEYLVKKDASTLRKINIEKYYDYTHADWYKAGLNELTWISSLYEPSINSTVVRLVVPFFQFDAQKQIRVPKGVIFVDVSHKYLQEFINTLSLEELSYGFIVANNDSLIAHSMQEYGEKIQTIDDIARLPGKKPLLTIAKQMKKNVKGIASYFDDVSHKYYWVVFDSIPSSQWFLVLIKKQEEPFININLRHDIFQIALFLSLFLFMALALVIFFMDISQQLWILSGAVSCLLLFLTCFLIYLNFTVLIKPIKHGKIVENKLELTRFTSLQERRNQQLKKPPIIYIPTGLLLNSIFFNQNNQIILNGFIWQKYDINICKDIQRGVQFLNADSLDLDQLYKHQNDGVETVGWVFHTVLNVDYDYTQYPFDQQNIVMQLYHPAFDKNIVLMPDFEAFKAIESELIGIHSATMSIEEWNINDTYFYYSLNSFKTDFGIPNFVRQEEFSNLNFVIAISRNIMGLLVVYLLPIILVSLILFWVLLEVSLLETEKNLMSSILSQIAGLFFATALTHQTFKRALVSAGVPYLEYYYFFMYAFIVLVSANAAAYLSKRKIFLLDFHKNLIPKILYWPTLLFASLVVTIVFFY